MMQQNASQNNLMISTIEGRSVPIVSQTEIDPMKTALSPILALATTTALTELLAAAKKPRKTGKRRPLMARPPATVAIEPAKSRDHETWQDLLLAKRGETVTKKQFYVYAIYVDGVVRYIGKGSNGRVHFHVIEARRINSRRARGANTDRTATKFYRKLAEAMRQGAIITEEIMLDGLTNQGAYRIEKQKVEELHKQKRDQLWNTIDERLIGVTWEKFKRKQGKESFQRRQGHRLVGRPAGRRLPDLVVPCPSCARPKIDPFLRQ
jgi:hypothetical protein